MPDLVVRLEQIGDGDAGLVGGKALHLGRLAHIDGVRVPPGFCVTTAAYRRVMAATASVDGLSATLARCDPDDRDGVRAVSAHLRECIEAMVLPADLIAEITGAAADLGDDVACAVRSSATAEDLPTASFAGQHDTFLNVVGPNAVLDHVRLCWASLYTERAVTYRLRNGIGATAVDMAVVVQQMVRADVAGTMFTADPVTSHRKVAVVEAAFGLGESLVSGRVNPDVYRIDDGGAVTTTLGAKRVTVRAAPSGGTNEVPVDAEQQTERALTDTQVRQLARLGRTIEAYFGRPQDIEWCLDADGFHIVQARPITTVFPIPDAGEGNHVFISVGHGQMMTDAMKPLGLSFWQLTTPRPMYVAGGRLFVDVAPDLASPTRRRRLLDLFLTSEPLTGDALRTVVECGDLIATLPDDEAGGAPAGGPPAGGPPPSVETDPAVVEELIARNRESVATLGREIRAKAGPELVDFIVEDIQELRRLLFDPRSHQVFMSAMDASTWLNDHLQDWLGETNAADTLTLSVPNNVTSEMGLALLDVADAIRPHPEVVEYLRTVGDDDDVLDGLAHVSGGADAAAALRTFLDTYGMRCAGEIDITRPRWSERPAMIVPVILSNVRSFPPGEAARRFDNGRQRAAAKEQDVLARLRTLPDGEDKAAAVKSRIDRVRTFIGYREYPKYGMVSRYFIYKQALLEEARRLVRAGVIRDPDDIFYLTVEELCAVVRSGEADARLIAERRAAYALYERLIPPRVFTSDGEVVSGAYHRDDVPDGALTGLPVSAGVVEGRARVLHDMADATIEPNDILVTAYTDPSWTPLFVAIAGLVTEVGGLMTHGAVIAREYGLPAVVGVENATALIGDGDLIRVNGTNGYVEILTPVSTAPDG